MVYFDSHCHLNDEAFASDLEETVAKAREAGLKAILVLGYDVISSRLAVEIASKYDICYAGVGIHPENYEGLSIDDIKQIEELSHNEKVIAIGEVGLDYHWKNDEVTKANQKAFFIEQIKLANKLGLPLSIHARDAAEDTFNILNEYRPTSGAVLHCYSGSVEMMERFSKLDLYFGFDGPLTYKNSIVPKECVKAINIDRLLVETDSPYLSPVPFRGKRNEPAYIPYIFNVMAELKGLTETELEEKLNANFSRLFHVKL